MEWNAKENKMFNQYISRFAVDIREIFGIAAQSLDSEEEKKRKEEEFISIVQKLKHIMKKRHSVSNILCERENSIFIIIILIFVT